MTTTEFEDLRSQMVDLQLVRRGITDRRVLDAFGQVPREAFLRRELQEYAYEDTALPIEEEQTISQPYIVAVTLEALALRGDERVLDVGTGSGYAAALLSLLAKQVVSIERIEPLASTARERLARLGYDNVQVIHGDGTLGAPDHAPYDAIAVAAAAPEIPRALLRQLAPGGRLVAPVGAVDVQILTLVTRESQTQFREEPITDVRFVPLIGEQDFIRDEARPRDHGKGVS